MLWKISYVRVLILEPGRPGKARKILLYTRLAMLRHRAFIDVEVTSHYPRTKTITVCVYRNDSAVPKCSHCLTRSQDRILCPRLGAKCRGLVCTEAAQERCSFHVQHNQILHFEFFATTQLLQEGARMLAPHATVE